MCNVFAGFKQNRKFFMSPSTLVIEPSSFTMRLILFLMENIKIFIILFILELNFYFFQLIKTVKLVCSLSLSYQY